MIRSFFTLLFCLCFSLTSYAGSSALDTLKSSTTKLLGIISDPQYDSPSRHEQLKSDAEKVVMNLFDFTEFSKRTLGKKWNGFTPSQRSAYVKAFTKLLRNTYINTLDSYKGDTIRFGSTRTNNKGDKVEIQATLISKNKKIPMSFRMLRSNGKWLVYDGVAENMSFVKNYQSQLAEILKTASPEETIKKIEQKAVEVAKNSR